VLEDPRALLLEWLRQSHAELHALAHAAPGTRAALRVHTTSASSLNLDALAASVGCSRSALTRNFRRVLGLLAGQHQRRLRLRNVIVLPLIRSSTAEVVDELVEQEMRSVSARRSACLAGPRPN
jgi:AraC-like DNA-binding protein